MRLISGAPFEKPQRTHRWNNRRMTADECATLAQDLLLHVSGNPTAIRRIGLVRFHIPILGGWRDYVTIVPTNNTVDWHIGWTCGETGSITLLSLTGAVRMLIGPDDTSFFGIDATGQQIAVKEIGRGKIGDGSLQSRSIPLL